MKTKRWLVRDCLPFTVIISMDVPQGRVEDLLTSALEGGSNYWYSDLEVKEWPKGKTKADFEFWHIEVPFLEGGVLQLMDDDENTHTLDRHKISQGLRVFASKYPIHWDDFIEDGDDAITGDVFLQCCIFGEAVYG